MKNGLPYYKAYPRDFIEGTIGMPLELKGAYRLVLDLIYMQGGQLPDDGRYISGLLGCTVRQWASIRSRLIELGKLIVADGYLTNNRAIIELETLAKLQDKQRENASGPRKNKGLEKPRLHHTEPEEDKKKEPVLRTGPQEVPDPPKTEPSPQPAKSKKEQAAAPGSAEDRFWNGVTVLEERGVSRAMCTKALKAVEGNFDRALVILLDTVKAREPVRYLGAIVRDLQGKAPPKPKSRDPTLPAWADDYLAHGYPVVPEGKHWRAGGALLNEEGEQIGN